MADTISEYESLADTVSMSSAEPPAGGTMTLTVLMCTTLRPLCTCGAQNQPLGLSAPDRSLNVNLNSVQANHVYVLRAMFCRRPPIDARSESGTFAGRSGSIAYGTAVHLHTGFSVHSHPLAAVALALERTCLKHAHSGVGHAGPQTRV